MKKHKKTIYIIFAVIFSLIYALFTKWWYSGNPFQSSTLVMAGIIFFNFLVLGKIGFIIVERSLNKSSTEIKKRAVPTLICMFSAILVLSLCMIGLITWIFTIIQGGDLTMFWKNFIYYEVPESIKHYSVWVLIGSVLFFYGIWNDAMKRELKLREENLLYKYRTLKSQVNPHFLFNSLNTLSEIIYSDIERSDIYIQKLAAIYRYILENEETDLIPLDDELGFIRHYFDLQKERDSNKIRMDIDVENPSRYKIIPVSLQILIENALKHNIASTDKPLIIKIYSNGDFITMSNCIQKKNILTHGPKTGLKNLSKRIKLITGRDMIIEEKDNCFTVSLPIIRNEYENTDY